MNETQIKTVFVILQEFVISLQPRDKRFLSTLRTRTCFFKNAFTNSTPMSRMVKKDTSSDALQDKKKKKRLQLV